LHYDAFRTADGGYGGLLSVVFHDDDHAVTFFDTIETAKGPSLGTNFTLTSPYTILAHYTELDWAAKYGVERGLVRISVGLEEKEALIEIFKKALEAIEKS
jgi:cystathionine gamma-synthase